MANSIAIGVAYQDQEIIGGSIDNTVIGATTPAAGTFTSVTATTGTITTLAATTVTASGAISGTQLKLNAPVSKTASFTLGAAENFVICNGAAANVAVTFPTASANTGRVVVIKNLSATYTVISASSNVLPLNSATPGTAILAATAGAWAILVCDGTNWVEMAAN